MTTCRSIKGCLREFRPSPHSASLGLSVPFGTFAGTAANSPAKNVENTRRIGGIADRCVAVFAPEGAEAPAWVQICPTLCARSDDSPMVIGTSLPGLRAMDGHSDFASFERPACLRRCLPANLSSSQAPTRSSAHTVPGRARDSHPHSPKRPSPFPSRPRRARRNHLCHFFEQVFLPRLNWELAELSTEGGAVNGTWLQDSGFTQSVGFAAYTIAAYNYTGTDDVAAAHD